MGAEHRRQPRARAGLATDVVVYDDSPSRYLTFTRRKHRWIRGDWQLLPWLRRRVPGPQGDEPNRLSLLSRWKILDNLRRSLVAPTLLLWLIIAWTVLPGSSLIWTLFVLLVLGRDIAERIHLRLSPGRACYNRRPS